MSAEIAERRLDGEQVRQAIVDREDVAHGRLQGARWPKGRHPDTVASRNALDQSGRLHS
jgi:hypothetical protein